MEPDFCFGVVLLGNHNVGKSSLLSCYVNGKVPEKIKLTSGVEFLVKTIAEPCVTTKLKIWDTAGHERFKHIVQSHYTNHDGALLVYDIHDRKSYSDVKKWAEELNDWTLKPRKVIALVGNKADISENRVVPSEEAEKYAERNGLIFWETSATTNLNVNKCFLEVAIAIRNAKKLLKHKRSSWYL
ncbi:ras-related protein rab-11.1-like isoform X2 [Drosophila elegans]|uniref:ras-related protein rab-11.1-like isoform X2 n=1 Tax=Drosophila elegans TaxID=30023 RepID=UPI001BC84089|nr:ras-related protein rab-11.1-like isoform X2 [Drosophila elegans]